MPEPAQRLVLVPTSLGERLARALRSAWARENGVEVVVADPDAPLPAGYAVAPLDLSVPLRLRRHRSRLVALRLLEVDAEGEREERAAAALVARIAAGDREAIRPLFAAWYDRTYAYLRATLADPRLAFGLTQDVFARIVADAGAFDPEAQRFTPWLVGHVHVIAFAAGVADAEEGRGAGPVPEVGDRIARIGDLDLLVLVHRLASEDRRLLVLRHVLLLRPDEAAAALGVDPASIAMREERAMATLRARIGVFGRSPQPHGSRVSSREIHHLSPVVRARRLALAPASLELLSGRT
jgi:RNA polymerase sigma-70 factor, ECF subfamily